MRIDLHLHTRFSGDSSLTPKFIVDALYAHPFVKAVAITDHDSVEGYFEVQRLAEAYKDLLIIPGVEARTKQGDLILLGIEEKPDSPLPIESVVDFARERAAVIVIPHPYRMNSGIGEDAEKIHADAIEVLNPTATRRENVMAMKLAKARNLPAVAGSDAHHRSQMWTAYTEIDARPNLDSILMAIRKGWVKAVPIERG